MFEANLKKTDLRESNLKNAKIKYCNMSHTIFELKPKSSPYIPSVVSAIGLSELTFIESTHSLVELRKALKEAGLRKLERKITYAIKHKLNQNLIKSDDFSNRLEGKLLLYLFEKTCKWGMSPKKPLLILIYLMFGLSFVYMFGIIGLNKNDGVWKVWIEDRVRKDLGKSEPKQLLKCSKFIQIWSYGFYFSLLSAFHIGWKDLNIGYWIARIHPREYTLRASGWVRIVSGIQSLISVYLLALSVLTYFGRPFDQF